jgi:hypothetical protein
VKKDARVEREIFGWVSYELYSPIKKKKAFPSIYAILPYKGRLEVNKIYFQILVGHFFLDKFTFDSK